MLRLSRGTCVRWTWISHFNLRVRTKNTKVGNHHGVEGNGGHLHGQACPAMSDVFYCALKELWLQRRARGIMGEAKGASCSVSFQILLRMRNIKTGDSCWTG